MPRILFLLFLTIAFFSCKNYGQLEVLATLPKELKEVSGIEKTVKSNLLWMLNDSGNKPIIYGVNTQGEVIRKVRVKGKNNDWEDITSDAKGNLYIADFGNNANKRKNLRILKIKQEDLQTKDEVSAEEIRFKYPEQRKFPPKKKKRFFDAEAIVFYKGFLYVFTKSSVKGAYGKTSMYKIPATKGSYTAKYIGSFNAGTTLECRITGAAIYAASKKLALLTHNTVVVFSNFKQDDFFEGESFNYPLKHTSQKESISFKNATTLYIADEKTKNKGGKLYSFTLK